MLQKKQNWFFLFFFLFLSASLFSQGIMPTQMESLIEQVRQIFVGPFVKTLLIIFLAATAIAYGFNKDNEKMKRNCVAIGVAIAIIIGAQWIVGAIWNASGGG